MEDLDGDWELEPEDEGDKDGADEDFGELEDEKGWDTLLLEDETDDNSDSSMVDD